MNEEMGEVPTVAGTFPGSSSYSVKDTATLPETPAFIPAARLTSPQPEALPRMPLLEPIAASMDVAGDSHTPATLQACSEPELLPAKSFRLGKEPESPSSSKYTAPKTHVTNLLQTVSPSQTCEQTV
jgi:hypothetical protein